MLKAIDFLKHRLEERQQQNLLRTLSTESNLIDFCSNDYLGFAQSEELKSLIAKELLLYQDYKLGSTGSRLITGNSTFIEKLEAEISLFHQAEAGLLYNSGYDANVGLFSCLPQRGDTLITDELIHASIIDGARLSYATRYTFKHNDLGSLKEKLQTAKGNIYVGVESVYSMDGDEAPLVEILSLCNKFGAALIVDEAHALGIYGEQGQGLVNQCNLQDKVFARVITFGKALGAHGAIVLGSSSLRSYLINFSRSFIYSTAAPFHSHISIQTAYRYLQQRDHQRDIKNVIATFKEMVHPFSKHFISSNSAIQSMLIGGNLETKKAAEELKNAGFTVKAILSPTVPIGKERLRICLHTFNTSEELSGLTDILKKLI